VLPGSPLFEVFLPSSAQLRLNVLSKLIPASYPASHPSVRESKSYIWSVYTAVKLKMEDNLTLLGKWKTTSICLEMEDNPNVLKIEDDLNFLENGRQPQLF
jgi:hypothetical protein